jgi:acyl carrier protein
MPVNRETILTVLFECIDELNQQLGKDQRIGKSADAVLVADGKGLDSLGFVNLIALVEEKCQERFGKALILTDSYTNDNRRDPFESVGTLAEYIELALQDRLNAWK